jgi:hypothetical protein
MIVPFNGHHHALARDYRGHRQTLTRQTAKAHVDQYRAAPTSPQKKPGLTRAL